MGISRRGVDYTPGTKFACDRELSPRVRNALWLYESSIAPTKRAAALMAGLAPMTLYQRTSGASNFARAARPAMQSTVHERIMSIKQIIEGYSHRAVHRIGELMESEDEQVAIRAASDMADRNPETAKTQKLEVAPALKQEDIQALAAGLVEAARVARANRDIGTADIIRLPGKVE